MTWAPVHAVRLTPGHGKTVWWSGRVATVEDRPVRTPPTPLRGHRRTRRVPRAAGLPARSAQRAALWRHSLARVPCAPGPGPGRCAADFELSGGAVRSAVITAASLAAARGTPVTEADLLEGARREYRKPGRLVLQHGADS